MTALSGAFRGSRDPVNQPAHRHGRALARLLLDVGADPNDQQALDNAGRYPYDDAHLPLLFRYGLGRTTAAPRADRGGHVSATGCPARPSWYRTNSGTPRGRTVPAPRDEPTIARCLMPIGRAKHFE